MNIFDKMAQPVNPEVQKAKMTVLQVVRWIQRQEWHTWDGPEAERQVKAQLTERGYAGELLDRLTYVVLTAHLQAVR